ncbi:MAG: hypothetical protein RL238_1031 [Actinomycetota bacterium]|jgi:hypothetical protein
MEPTPIEAPATAPAPIAPVRDASTGTERYPGLAVAALASLGAGAVHAAATGIHAEHPELARLFVVITVLQLGAGLWALLRPTRLAAVGVVVVNTVAVGGWLVTRLTGISWIDGLADREAAQFADTVCAALGAVAAGAALAALLVGKRPAAPTRLAVPALCIAALAVPAMWTGGTHAHSHEHAEAGGALAAGDESQPHSHDTTGETATGDTVDESQPHTHDTAHDTNGGGTDPALAIWPRAWDPATGIDLSGVPGVTAEQQARAQQLIDDTLRELPKWSTVAAAEADGYRSIGDAGTGSEHFIKRELIQDDVMLDPTQPESLVFTVKGNTKTLAGAMFIASARPTDDPSLTDWAGPLMTWHNHGNLCWDQVNGVATVVGLTDASGKCARGVNTGGANPMVHVWITPHQCGPFAALEGVGAGQASVSEEERVDMCHEHSHDTAPAAEPKPYDPAQPIDLSGTPGVTPEQQAAAENLIAVTLVRLPQWSDYKVAEAAGFHSIGDGATGHEHFINWDWINDDVILDPDMPESLVYAPQPDGSKKLVSAMYMLPDTVALDDVPDIGGALMQWHIHDNLCFTNDPVAPRVAGLTNGQGECNAPLVKFRPAPMIHVWITPHQCGPFAALEGVGAGQIAAGEERLCDHQHGGGF